MWRTCINLDVVYTTVPSGRRYASDHRPGGVQAGGCSARPGSATGATPSRPGRRDPVQPEPLLQVPARGLRLAFVLPRPHRAAVLPHERGNEVDVIVVVAHREPSHRVHVPLRGESDCGHHLGCDLPPLAIGQDPVGGVVRIEQWHTVLAGGRNPARTGCSSNSVNPSTSCNWLQRRQGDRRRPTRPPHAGGRAPHAYPARTGTGAVHPRWCRVDAQQGSPLSPERCGYGPPRHHPAVSDGASVADGVSPGAGGRVALMAAPVAAHPVHNRGSRGVGEGGVGGLRRLTAGAAAGPGRRRRRQSARPVPSHSPPPAALPAYTNTAGCGLRVPAEGSRAIHPTGRCNVPPGGRGRSANGRGRPVRAGGTAGASASSFRFHTSPAEPTRKLPEAGRPEASRGAGGSGLATPPAGVTTGGVTRSGAVNPVARALTPPMTRTTDRYRAPTWPAHPGPVVAGSW
jgi:hypothetical protein